MIARARRTQAILAGVPAAVLLAFCVLLGVGALDGPAAVTLAWAVLGGLAVGLAYQLPARGAESGVLRAEVFPGLSAAAFVLAKAAVLLPVLAIADALILAVPAAAAACQAGSAWRTWPRRSPRLSGWPRRSRYERHRRPAVSAPAASFTMVFTAVDIFPDRVRGDKT